MCVYSRDKTIMPNQSFQGQIKVEVITLTLYYAAEFGSFFHVAPAYESALKDIERSYPRLKFNQNIVTDKQHCRCGEMTENSDDLIGKFYFGHGEKWRRANVTVFINAGAGTSSIFVLWCLYSSE